MMNAGTSQKILLVEDNGDIREGLVALLESEGYAVTECASAEEGLAHLKERTHALVITDFMLPGHNGGWLLEEATRAGLLSDCAVLMMTAHPRVQAPPGARILSKPLDIDDFLRVVRESLDSVMTRDVTADAAHQTTHRVSR